MKRTTQSKDADLLKEYTGNVLTPLHKISEVPVWGLPPFFSPPPCWACPQLYLFLLPTPRECYKPKIQFTVMLIRLVLLRAEWGFLCVIIEGRFVIAVMVKLQPCHCNLNQGSLSFLAYGLHAYWCQGPENKFIISTWRTGAEEFDGIQ